MLHMRKRVQMYAPLQIIIYSSNNTLSENSAPGSIELASSDGVLIGQAASSNLSTIGLVQSNG